MRKMARDKEELAAHPFKPQLVKPMKKLFETISMPESSRYATIQHSPRQGKERFESLYADSERRSINKQEQQKKKNRELDQMHKKTNQVLKLSSIFKKNNDSNVMRESIQSEVKSDHEIKAIITELQTDKDSAAYQRRVSEPGKSDYFEGLPPRMAKLYQQSFRKKEKMEQLALKVQKDRGITFKPNINSKYKAPLRIKRNTKLPEKTKSGGNLGSKDPLNIPFYPSIEYD